VRIYTRPFSLSSVKRSHIQRHPTPEYCERNQHAPVPSTLSNIQIITWVVGLSFLDRVTDNICA
jgi:hypothetical protein